MATERGRTVRVGAYAWCERDGQLLLSRYRSPDSRWVLPGGGVDHGEAPEDAVLRELGEETGMSGELVDLVGIRSELWDLPTVVVHNLAVVYRIRVTGGTLRAEIDGSSDAADWFPLDALAELPRTELLDWALDRLR